MSPIKINDKQGEGMGKTEFHEKIILPPTALCRAGLALLSSLCPLLASAETYVWNGGVEWADFGTAGNWSVNGKLSDGGSPANVPGAEDFISCDPVAQGTEYILGRFDLGGGAWTIKGWVGSTVAWKHQSVSLSNGTLVVKEPSDVASGSSARTGRRFTVESGGTLVYPAGNATTRSTLAASGLAETWTVNDGGAVEIFGAVGVQGPAGSFGAKSEVLSGGRLVFDPQKFIVGSSNNGGYAIDNYGTMELPHGVNWSGEAWSGADGACSEDRLTFRQLAGTAVLGGDFVKTARSCYSPGRMTFVLGGGTIKVSGNVRFYTADSAYDTAKGFGEQVYAEMPDSATAIVDVREGVAIDMRPFTYGDGTALTKSGLGAMILGVLPSALSVYAGSVTLAKTLSGDERVTLSEGAKVVFGAKGNDVGGLVNIGVATYTVGDGFAAGDVIATGGDAATLDAIAANFEMPEYLSDCKVRVCDGALALCLSIPVEIRARDLTLYEGDAVTNAGYIVVDARTGEVVDTGDIYGVPEYSYGYAPGSGAGSYPIAVSGLMSENLDISYREGTMTVVPSGERLVFHWKGGREFADFGDVGNWAMDAAHSVAATRLPGRNDMVANMGESYGDSVYGTSYHLAKWDFRGGERRFYGYAEVDGFTAWKNWWIDLTNGTLVVGNPTATAGPSPGVAYSRFGHLYNVWSGATLTYPANAYENKPLAHSGLLERWKIHAGGTVRAFGGVMFASASNNKGGVLVETGGTLLFSPEALSVSAFNSSGIEIVNRGDMICPRGLVWTGTGYTTTTSVASGRDELLVVQEAGRMLLGGDVMRTNNFWAAEVKLPSRLELILKGGTLEVTNSVRVVTSENSYMTHIAKWGEEAGEPYRIQAFASIAEDADVVIDVKPDSFIDMTEFMYGANARLTTRGLGRILFGETLPSELVFDGGEIAYSMPAAATVPSAVTLGSTASGRFALRVWKNSEGVIRNDRVNLSGGGLGSAVIRPTAFGFKFTYGDCIRLGSYPAGMGLPSAAHAKSGWTFCRMSGDEDSLYMRYDGGGMKVLVR